MPSLQKTSRRNATSLELANVLRPTITRLARRLRQQDRTGLGPTMTAALSSIDKSAIVAASLPKDIIGLATVFWPYKKIRGQF